MAHRSPATIIRGQLPPGWSRRLDAPCVLVASRSEAPRDIHGPAGAALLPVGRGRAQRKSRDRGASR